MILDLGAASFGNGYLFTELKGNSPLIKKLGQCILILMSILPIVVEYLKCLKNNVNENIQCDHGYAYYSGKNKMCAWVNEESWAMMKTCFTDANKIKNPKNTLCKECTYVHKYGNESDETFYSPLDNKPTFSSSYFHEEPIVYVETIEERLKEMNFHRVKKRDELSSQEYDKDRTV